MFQLRKDAASQNAPVRYAVRQVLEQELRKEKVLRNTSARHARSTSLNKYAMLDLEHDDKENADVQNPEDKSLKVAAGVKRDFFGRVINEVRPASVDGKKRPQTPADAEQGNKERIWVSFHEGYSNAVRKPITLKELIQSFELP